MNAIEEYNDEQIDIDTILKAIDELPEDQVRRWGTQILEYKLKRIEPSGNAIEDLKTAKDLVQSYLMESTPSEVDESILILQEKFKLTDQQRRILSKFYKEEKKKFESRKKQQSGVNYDLDSTSGRAKICKDVEDIYIRKQYENNTPVKCINGKLMKYKSGIYEDSEEERSFMSKEIKDIGESLGIIMPATLIDQTVKLIKLDTLVRAADCEPNNSYVVVLNNGIINTRTWEFEDFDTEKVYFSKIPIDYLPDAPEPKNFLKFINTCFAGNEKQIPLLQEAFGYALTKTYKHQVIFYLLGNGGNGKGSAMGLLMMLLGAENYTSFSLHQLTDGNNIEYNIAMLHGKYANICGDVGTAKVIDTEHIKQLSSNTDSVTGRHVREKPFQFINYAKLFFLMNRAPKTDAHTTGDDRRIRIINFNNSFSEKPGEIKDIHKVIAEAGELPGILLWAIEGLKRLEKNQDFTDTRTISQRALEYDKKSNTMRYFVEECIEADHMGIIPREVLFEKYNNFVKEVGGAQLGRNEIKSEFIAECEEAGWKGVYCKQERIKKQLEEVQNVLRNDYKVKGEKSYFFYGVSLIENEPQKTVEEFATPANEEPHVCSSDAEAYEMMQAEGLL